jgi:hypothetical protein
MQTLSPVARLAYDPHSPRDDDDASDDYSLDGTKRLRATPVPAHGPTKSGYTDGESLCDPTAENAAVELRKSLTDASWGRRLPSSQAIMRLGAGDIPPVPPLPVDKNAWVGQVRGCPFS